MGGSQFHSLKRDWNLNLSSAEGSNIRVKEDNRETAAMMGTAAISWLRSMETE